MSGTDDLHELVKRALSGLGRGFDLTSDFRLKYSKGSQRLVSINEDQKRELTIPGIGILSDIPADIKCEKGDRTRYRSDILDFNQMSEFFNQRCSVTGKIPSGLFTSLFKFESSSWAKEAANCKYLGLDCYSMILLDIHIDRYPLNLSQQVSDSVPSAWDPSALARFIEKYGTHIIVGLSIGGRDMILLKQDKSSKLGPAELKKHLDELGDQHFEGICSFTPRQLLKAKYYKQKASMAFNAFELPAAASFSDGFSSVSSKDGITVIHTKRGGDPSSTSHHEWLRTVPSMPDPVHFTFIPITCLLKNIPGKGFLSHAINLYLRHKPPIADLAYFLDFQTHKAWAPAYGDLPLAPTTNVPLLKSLLQVNLIGPKLYVNTSQVAVEKRPVIGMRLHLEGMKGNKLAIHLQPLSNTPTMYDYESSKTDEGYYRSFWRGSDDIVDFKRYFEPITRQKLSYVCAAPITPDLSSSSSAFIVTGAQLHVKEHESKHVLHLRLLFTNILGLTVVKSNWVQEPLHNSRFFPSISTTISESLEKENDHAAVVVDSSIYPDGPPLPAQTQKLLRFVDTSPVCQGPQDSPGYWLVTGAKIGLVRGKVCLHVQFSLLNSSI